MIDNNTLLELPRGWAWTKIGEIAEINPGLKDNNVSDNIGVSFLPMSAVDEQTGGFNSSIIRKYGEVKKGYTAFKNGDILFAKITPCMENGKITIVSNLKNGIGFGSTEFHIIRLIDEEMAKKLFFFYVLQENFRQDARKHMKGTAGQLRVPADYIRHAIFPLPPLSEQHRLVAKIEELFTKLDAGVEALKKVKAQLKRYRQSVLKHAFEGKLTEEWREAHKGEMEPASVLIERIKKERKKKAKRNYKELPPLDTSDLPELPKGWVWTRIGEIIHIIDYRGRTPPFSLEGIPHLRSSNIKNGKIMWDGLKYISETTYQKYMTRGLPQKGDLLLTTEAPLGDVALTPDQKFSLAQRIMMLRPLRGSLKPKYLFYQIMSERFQGRLKGKGTGTTVTGISSRNFRPLELIVPTLLEQDKIVEEIERRLSMADGVEKIVDESLKRSERLRQSILKTAFEGKLVPQDSSDEPAEKLLERIKAEKAKHVFKKKSKRTIRMKKSREKRRRCK